MIKLIITSIFLVVLTACQTTKPEIKYVEVPVLIKPTVDIPKSRRLPISKLHPGSSYKEVTSAYIQSIEIMKDDIAYLKKILKALTMPTNPYKDEGG